MMHQNKARPALFCLLLACLCGCAPPLSVQNVGTNVPTVFSSTGSGEGDSAWYARYEDMLQATLDAGENLSLELIEKTIGTDQSVLNFIDDQGSKLDITIERRTDSVTRVHFDVGFFGSTSMGRLMARQII